MFVRVYVVHLCIHECVHMHVHVPLVSPSHLGSPK